MFTTSTETLARVHAEIVAVAREILREPELAIAPEDDLREQLGLDSADLAELLVMLEERLGVPLPERALIPSADWDPLATVDTLTRTVARECDRARH
ncbi:acyl carrier protein [Sciscionella marina]|uniref:acyl carrier protein n=1 Tax=Sciscionella marina TaxID=508770 RepID=UPI0009FE49C8|nr:acyl carrier protein [Sciscionella marina]